MDIYLLCVFLLIGPELVLLQTYTRTGKGLEELPNDIPQDTVELKLDYNNLANVDFLSLAGIPLERIELSTNGFTSFPNLTAVGMTLIYIQLNSNLITCIATDLLEDLIVLEELIIYCRGLTVFPDFSPVGDDTLLLLNLNNNYLQIITSWRQTVKQGAKFAEEALTTAALEKRNRRKERSKHLQQPTPFSCPKMWQRLPLTSWSAQPFKEVQIDSNYGSYTIISRNGRIPTTASDVRPLIKLTYLNVANNISFSNRRSVTTG